MAIDNWHKAGERALRRSATLEAVQHLTSAIELTHSLPARPNVTAGNSTCTWLWDVWCGLSKASPRQKP